MRGFVYCSDVLQCFAIPLFVFLVQVVPDVDGLDAWEQEFRSRLTAAAPTAVVASKELVSAVAGKV